MKGNNKKGSAWGGAKAVVWGLGILALVFGFALAGCDDGSAPGGEDDTSYAQWNDSLVPHTGTDWDGDYRYGRWTGDGGTFEFRRASHGYSTLKKQSSSSNEVRFDHGSLQSRDGDTYILEEEWNREYTFTATVEGTNLTFSNCSWKGGTMDDWGGPYTLQDAD